MKPSLLISGFETLVAGRTVRPAIVLGIMFALASGSAHAKQDSEFTACEAQDGLAPVQAMLFAGQQPDAPDYAHSEQPDDDGGGGLAEPADRKPSFTFWDLKTRPKPWNLVCGFVDAKSKAATDESYLGTDDSNSITKHITVPVPDAATKCTIIDVPGPNKDFPMMSKIVCNLKPGANQTQKPNRS